MSSSLTQLSLNRSALTSFVFVKRLKIKPFESCACPSDKKSSAKEFSLNLAQFFYTHRRKNKGKQQERRIAVVVSLLFSSLIEAVISEN